MPLVTPKFIQDESGAVTVDWVVLTAAIVGLGIATYGVVSGGISNLSGDVDTHLRTDWIDTAFGASGGSGSIDTLTMRVFTDTQRAESYATAQGYDDDTLKGMIAQFETITAGQDLDKDPYAAMSDSLEIAKFERDQRL